MSGDVDSLWNDLTGRVIAYHGTTEEIANQIVTDASFVPKDADYHWLGDGAYLFQESPNRALTWAMSACERKPGTKPAVVQAIISLQGCLDLLDPFASDVLCKSIYPDFTRALGDEDQTLTQEGLVVVDGVVSSASKRFGQNRRDCRLINFAAGWVLHKFGLTVRSVRAPFLEGDAVYRDSFLFSLSHVQICVRDGSAVLDRRIFDRHLSEGPWPARSGW